MTEETKAADGAPSGVSDSTQLLGDEIYAALREIVDRVERCGASPELTHAVTLASDLAQAIGNRWNPPYKAAVERVRAVVWLDIKLNGLFCPVHGAGVAACNCKVPPNAELRREP